MSAMETMAKNILSSLIPPEIMALMTEENITKAKAVMVTFIEQQTTINNNVEEILEYVRSRPKPRGGTPKLTADTSGTGD